nr:MAG TPA: hypothetical protein [Caudoviricetes sp.]
MVCYDRFSNLIKLIGQYPCPLILDMQFCHFLTIN